MINSPWNATVLRQHRVGGIISELAVAKAVGGLVKDSNSVILVTPLNEKIPAFVMPITSHEYADRKLDENGAVFVDGRSYMRAERRNDAGYVVANQMQADFVNRLGELTALWVKAPTQRMDFLRTGDIAAQVYINWLSTAIASKLGLELDVARELQIITGLFYIHQFMPVDEALSQSGKERAVKLIQRWTKAPVEMINSIVSDAQYMNLMEDYVAVVQGHFSASTRIAQINVGFMVMALNRSWFGYGAQEMSAVAIEYPPAFLALVEAACNAKVWRKTYLGRLVERFSTGRASDEFTKSMEILAGRARGTLN